ncbi:hypothetical protein ILP92_13265 [Maribius pontilimi]|uniref:Uncharacterized protein n=1 Tax=Palleronia pontilimi TaxID=1964209 RepID=A0A934IIU5_9RHOB|nr:hypothetical protein [Palleronia pontilimi]MBJ3763721.1 hypothetical protein [Palleronia pontilimi]
MTDIAATRYRLMIGAASFADARAALGIADLLAQSMASELVGVLMEDTEVTSLFASPGRRIVTIGGSVVAAPSVARLRAALDNDARAFRKALGAIARQHKRAWSVRRQTGELVAGLCKVAGERDLLLLGQAHPSKGVGRVIVIAPPTGVPQRMAGLGRTLAETLRARLATVSLDSDAGADAVGMSWADETELLRWLSRIRAAAVIVDLSAGPFTTVQQLRQVVDVARCPVLVLGLAADRRSGSVAPGDEGRQAE